MKKTTNDNPKVDAKVVNRMPVIPLRDLVLFPRVVIPIVIGRESTKAALEAAASKDNLMVLVAQKDSSVEDPKPSDLHRVGTLARMSHAAKLPNGLVKVLVEGMARLKISRINKNPNGYLEASYEIIKEKVDKSNDIEAAYRVLIDQFKNYISLNKHIPDELVLAVDSISNHWQLADLITINVIKDLADKQKNLETSDLYSLLVRLANAIEREIEILSLEQNIEGKVKDKITRSQRAFFLQEQMRAIKRELGEDLDDDLSDVMDYRKKIKKAKMSKQAQTKAEEELKRLENTPIMSPEATIIRTYLDWLVDLPWSKGTVDNNDIGLAQKILDEDHFGLEKPKERILEHLSVLAYSGKVKGSILCLVGPPGVGKTSLGKSIARSLGRNFVRVSLGGVRDEAEIRGHRRTYIGSMPGRIIQSMKRAGSQNPVFLLDEIDKMSMDFRGDPSAALLEVLDPEQNQTFSDHYLEVDYDLSQIFFLTTANSREGIPWPLQDRMEIIQLPGYLHQEKYQIAKRFLIPKQQKEVGIQDGMVKITDSAVNTIISRYTREAGVRELERNIAKVYRVSARELLVQKDKLITVDSRKATQMLGVQKFDEHKADRFNKIGAVLGLAWTASGGDILTIEAESLTGKGTLTLTGHLGTVMQESAKAALTAVRSRANSIGFDAEEFMNKEIHVHVPEGAVAKDGPSAGITIAVAIASTMSKRMIDGNFAMTGEITLRGDVLPIGGLREKLMAALRSGIKRVIIPDKNKAELAEVPNAVKKPLEIIRVKTVDEVLKYVLLPKDAISDVPSKEMAGRKSASKASNTVTIT